MIEKNLSDVLNNTKFFTLSTVCADGSPWGTPIGWWAFDTDRGQIVFDNRIGTVHATNLAHDSRCFITIVNYDQEHSRSVHVSTTARKLSGSEYDRAKQLILDRGLDVTDDIFVALLGEMDKEKSKASKRDDGSLRFHCYFVNKEAK